MFETIIDTINTFLYSKLLIVILIGSGIYFTGCIKLQRTYL